MRVTRIESRASAAAQVLVVAAILGAALAAVFLPLMNYAQAMGEAREYRIWVAEWVFFDVVLTAVLCRRELAVLLGRRQPDSRPGEPGSAPPSEG
jgi:hypothetical protein